MFSCTVPSGTFNFLREKGMKRRLIQFACILLIMLGLCVLPSLAQLASYVNDSGNLVFTNPDPPVKPHGSAKAGKPSPRPRDGVAAGAPSSVPAGPVSAPSSPGTAAKAKNVPVAMEPAALNQLVEHSAEQNHVDPALVRAVISTESNWNSSAVSSKGAMGLMQLIPGTADSLGVGNAFDPVQNVDAGTRYLGMMLQRYNGDVSKALAAYNAGPGAVDRFGGVPDYAETRNYVQKVTSTYFHTGSERKSSASRAHAPIYRETDASGRVVFVNE